MCTHTSLPRLKASIGIMPEQMESIFAPFVQAEGGHTRRSDGTGLGLTITRSLVKLMGWQIEVRSEPGVGSTFSVIIPADAHGRGASGLSPGASVADEDEGVDTRG